jgi:hypothetical protein
MDFGSYISAVNLASNELFVALGIDFLLAPSWIQDEGDLLI